MVREPDDPLYAQQWRFDLPQTHGQALDAPGRPAAHLEFLRSHDALVGAIANEEARWRRRHNYYLNCLRDVDRNIGTVLDELEAAGQLQRTIILFTSDHGDMDGAHQLHAKGSLAYREQNHVPLIVAHPAHPGGNRCRALTCHLDLAPTLIGFAAATPERQRGLVEGLPGRDCSALLAAAEQAELNAVRDAVLFNYNMFAYLDADFLHRAVAHIRQGGHPAQLAQAGIVPDLMKRGALRILFDGRYVFARYFSPRQHNQPTSLEQLYRLNDVELYDSQADPLEFCNLAAPGPDGLAAPEQRELVQALNLRLNALIEAEVGEDLGRMLPAGLEGGWAVTAETMAP